MQSSPFRSLIGPVAVALLFVGTGCVDDVAEDGTGGAGGAATTGGGETSGPTSSATSGSPSANASTTDASSGANTATTSAGGGGADPLRGYWVWEKRVQGTAEQSGDVDSGQMKLAFGTGNDKCHYLWNETTGSDFHTECTYSVAGEMVSFVATADADGTAAGYSCAHPDWTTWNDRPSLQWGRYKFVGDRLWIGVNSYWGFGGGVTLSDGTVVPPNGSLKRFPFWESEGQAQSEESWIVFMPVTREDWYTTYAISTTCQGTPDLCSQWPGCGPGDKGYVD